jgi:hypothetical protein
LKRSVLFFVLVTLVLTSIGCYRVHYVGRKLQRDVLLSQEHKISGTYHGHIEETTWNHFFINGLVPTYRPDLEDIFGTVPEDCSVVNVTVATKHSFLNKFVGCLTAGLYTPTTSEFTGDIICKDINVEQQFKKKLNEKELEWKIKMLQD